MSIIKPLVIGHRGAPVAAPENTLSAFREAVAQGVDMVELDVRMSKDDQIVVCHDETIDRTSDGKGEIREMTLQEIQSYDAGSWFGEAFRGEKIPTLEQVIEMLPPGVWINVEVKDFYGGRLGEKLAELLHRTERLATVVVSAFAHKDLVKFKQSYPEILIGLLYFEDLYDHVSYAKTLPVPIYSLHPYYKSIPLSDITAAKENGIEVFPFTINEQEDMVSLIKDGVSGLITNYPDRLRQLV